MKNISIGVSKQTLAVLHEIKKKIAKDGGYFMSFNAIIMTALKDKYPEECGMGFGSVDEIGGGND